MLKRFKVLKFIYFGIIVLIIIRLGYWQIIKGDDLSARAEGQRLVSQEIVAPRGKILFSDQSVLVSNQPTFLIFAQPQIIQQKYNTAETLSLYQKDVAKKLTEIFWLLDHQDESIDGVDQKRQLQQMQNKIVDLLNKNLYWVSLGRKVDKDTKERIEKMNLLGIGFEKSSARFYPEGSSSAHLLGFVGSDIYGKETGYFGLEGFYNGELKGKNGRLIQEKDALGLPILIGKFSSRSPQPGKTLLLNIDRSIQHMVEDKLKLGMEKYQAKSASAIVMDPQTGNILAMASYPSYSPSNPVDYPKENFKNPIVADSYEPGSTFKVLLVAAAINEGVVKPDTKCDSCDGPLNIGGFTIRTWNNQYRPNLTITDTIIHSDNTGMVFVSKKLGLDKLYSYIQKFGFGSSTGIDLQDEQSPDLRDKKDWHEIDQATVSFGQGISVTALQIVRAVGAIANGGKLMEPHVVSAVIDSQGGVSKINSKVVSQPITPKTAQNITEMMVRAVNEGEAQYYKKSEGVTNFKIAGKTGTAQIPVAGHYDSNKTIASFVGFAPADNPKFIILVRYEQPTAAIFGAETAAPTFFQISKDLFNYYGIAPDNGS